MLAVILSLVNKLQQEEGLETVEWAGMVVVMVVLLLAVAGFISSGDSQIGQAVLDVFESWIRSLSG
jgi:hypothetical protein